MSLSGAGALRVIEEVAGKAAGAARIGAGTVLTADDARRARDAGAEYAVTPSLGPGVDEALRLGLPVLAGALTPTEVAAAAAAGATAVKLFPAAAHGPGYLTALRDPFPDVPFVPVGGVGRPRPPSTCGAAPSRSASARRCAGTRRAAATSPACAAVPARSSPRSRRADRHDPGGRPHRRETMMALRATGPVRLGSGFTAGIAGAESNVAIGPAARPHHRLGGTRRVRRGRAPHHPHAARRGSTPRPSTATPPRPPA